MDLLAAVITGVVVFSLAALAYAALRPQHKRVAAADSNEVQVVQTDGKLGQKMKPLAPIALTGTGSRSSTRASVATTSPLQTIRIDPAKTEQTYWGVGAAITDSSAYLIHTLPVDEQTKLLHTLFGPSELGLSFGSIPIGASDYTASGEPYTYDDLPAGETDPQLEHFSIAHDEEWILPVLQQIARIQPAMKYFAVTWTAPAWMKANDQYDNVFQSGGLLPQYYSTFADYLVDFIEAYQARGIQIAAISPENEPNSPSYIPSMFLPTQDQATFIADDLAPALKANGLSTEIFGGDVGMPRLKFQKELVASPAGKDLSGLAWHCYSDPPTQMTLARQAYPGLTQLVTECSEKLSGEPMQEDLLGTLENQASGFSAWNLALTSDGGPVQLPNRGCPGCRGLVTVDQKNGTYELSNQAYVLGQVGHFVDPGARRVQSSDEPTFVHAKDRAFALAPSRDGLLNVAYRNPDGQLVLVVYNSHARSETFDVSDGFDHFTATLPAGAMTTFTWG